MTEADSISTPQAIAAPQGPESFLTSTLRLALLFAVVKLAFQFALTLWTEHIGYGYFRDEFYYPRLRASPRLGLCRPGPPSSRGAGAGSRRMLFGTSVFGIRVLSGCCRCGVDGLSRRHNLLAASAVTVPLRRLAMPALMLTPQYIGVDGFLSMNSCEAFVLVCRAYSRPS